MGEWAEDRDDLETEVGQVLGEAPDDVRPLYHGHRIDVTRGVWRVAAGWAGEARALARAPGMA